MVEYLTFFLIAGLAYYYAEKTYKFNRVISWSLVLLGTLILSVFSGIRDYSVGTDILVYGNNIFLDSTIYPFFSVVERNKRWADIGYVMLNWIVSRISENPHFFYGALTFLTTLITLKVFYKYKKKISFTFATILFLLILWPLHLNILRQGLAMAILGMELYFIDRKKYFPVMLLATIAFFIHDSSIIVSLIFIGCKLLIEFYSRDKKRSSIKITAIILCIGIIIPIIFNQMPAGILTEFDPKYYYISNSFLFGQFSLSRALLFALPVIYYFKRVMNISFKNNKSLMLMYIISLLNIVFNGYAATNYYLFGRTSYYFYIPFIIFISMCVSLSKGKNRRIMESTLWTIYAFILFYGLLYVENYGNLFPYEVDRYIKLLF